MLLLVIVQRLLVIFSALATALSFVLTISPRLFLKIEEFLCMEFSGSIKFVTVVEGEVDMLHVWAMRNRILIGPLFTYLAFQNTKNIIIFAITFHLTL